MGGLIGLAHSLSCYGFLSVLLICHDHVALDVSTSSFLTAPIWIQPLLHKPKADFTSLSRCTWVIVVITTSFNMSSVGSLLHMALVLTIDEQFNTGTTQSALNEGWCPCLQ